MKQIVDTSSVWRFLSTFFNYLDDMSREIWEYFWEGVAFISNEMSKQAARFLYSSSPERSYVESQEAFYEVVVDILKAKSTPLDATDPNSRSVILCRRAIVTNPFDGVRNDMVEIEKADYDHIRDIAIGQYLVIMASDSDPKYFVVLNTMSPEETGSRYYDSYVLVLENANLSYITPKTKISAHLTTGKTYLIDDYVLDIDALYTNINSEDDGVIVGKKFVKDDDFTYTPGIVEFVYDNIALGNIANGTSLYAKDVNVMETNLWNSFGALVDIKDWKLYKHDNIGGKAAMCAIIKALQNPSNAAEYEKALNVYYGIPVAPEKSTVVGLFESYDYTILAIDVGNRIVTFSTTPLHQFIQPGTKLILDGTDDLYQIEYDAIESNVINRTLGSVKLLDVTGLSVGSKMNIMLNNRIPLYQIANPGYVNPRIIGLHWTAGGDIQYIQTKVYNDTVDSGNVRYPEILIWNNSNGYNGYYHFLSCSKTNLVFDEQISFEIKDQIGFDEEPKYNDFINLTAGSSFDTSTGYVHCPWPTHKYLLLRFDDGGELYKCYLDSPIDTIYDRDDKVDKYQVLGRCISSYDDSVFTSWNEFSAFKRNNGIDPNSNFLELTATIPYAKFGEYF